MPFSRRPKIDIVVVAIRYEAPGKIAWVRAYERRGKIWSDRIMIQRADLIARIRAGQHVMTGERIEFEAGTFKIWEAVRVEDSNGASRLLAEAANGSGDDLNGVPAL